MHYSYPEYEVKLKDTLQTARRTTSLRRAQDAIRMLGRPAAGRQLSQLPERP